MEFTQLRPSASKKLGRRVQLRPDWEEVKVGIMEEIVRAKFTQNEDLKWRLIGTGDAYLEEGNTWHDTCWGVDAKTGAIKWVDWKPAELEALKAAEKPKEEPHE